MKHRVFMLSALVASLLLGACSAQQAANVQTWLTNTETKIGSDGQLFCQRYTATGPQIFGMVNAGATIVATAYQPASVAVPLVILATNLSKASVDAICAQIGAVPVSPPAAPVPQIAVVPPPAVPALPGV